MSNLGSYTFERFSLQRSLRSRHSVYGFLISELWIMKKLFVVSSILFSSTYSFGATLLNLSGETAQSVYENFDIEGEFDGAYHTIKKMTGELSCTVRTPWGAPSAYSCSFIEDDKSKEPYQKIEEAASTTLASESEVDFYFTLKNFANKKATQLLSTVNKVMFSSYNLNPSNGECIASVKEFRQVEEDIYVFANLQCYSFDQNTAPVTYQEMKRMVEKDMSKEAGIILKVSEITNDV